MAELKFRDDPAVQARLAKAQQAIDDFVASHSKNLNAEEHAELRALLSERADALSEATGSKIHSLFD